MQLVLFLHIVKSYKLNKGDIKYFKKVSLMYPSYSDKFYGFFANKQYDLCQCWTFNELFVVFTLLMEIRMFIVMA